MNLKINLEKISGAAVLLTMMFSGTACAAQTDQDSQSSQGASGGAVWGTPAPSGNTSTASSAYVPGPGSSSAPVYQQMTPQQREQLKVTMKQTAAQVGQVTKDFKEFYGELQKAVQDSGIVEEVNKMNLGNSNSGMNSGRRGGFGAADIKVGDADQTVLVDLPGVAKKDVAVTLTSDSTSVRIRVNRIAPDDAAAYAVAERPRGNFEKIIQLPYKAKGKSFRAELRDGVLMVVIPREKTASSGEVTIPIS
jgi:HSP20 family protein